MAPNVVFVEGYSIKTIKDRDKRRQIRSDIIRRSWASKKSHRNQDTTGFETEAVVANQETLHEEGGLGKAVQLQPQDDTTDILIDNTSLKSPKSLLSASRADPFGCFGLKSDDRSSQAILDYCVNDLWPGFRPYDTYATEFARCWFAHAAHNPVVMAAILFASSLHRHVRIRLGWPAGNPDHTERQLQLKGDVIRTLREEFTRVIVPEKIDEMIYAILCLSTTQNATTAAPRLPDKTNFEPLPLESQWLALYGSIDFDPTHFNAILALVRLAGGITNIRSYSVGWLVFFASLMGAANNVTPPIFPPVNMYGCLLDYQSPLRLLHIFTPPWHHRALNGGFHALTSRHIRPDIIQTLLDISEFSQALEIGLRRSIDKKVITPLLDSRSHLVYRVLSLPVSTKDNLAQTPDSHTSEEVDQGSSLYACARLASQLYSLHVLLPVSRTADIRRILLPEIMTQVSAINQVEVLNEASLQLTAWVCMVAAIASSADNNETSDSGEKWFVHQLTRAAVKLGISSYEEMREVLQLFGWIDAVCDRYGTVIWNTRWNE